MFENQTWRKGPRPRRVSSVEAFLSHIKPHQVKRTTTYISVEAVGAVNCPSGWLPFRNDIDGLLTGEDSDDPFGSDPAEEEAPDPAVKILGYVRDLLSIDDPKPPSRNDSALSTPVFLGHGDADEKIRPSLGREAYQAMKAIGFRVDWKSYEGQGHWYKIPNEIDDIVDFIQTGIGWPI